MSLWSHWWVIVKQLRCAFTRYRTFLWFVVCLIGLSIRPELLGVTSIIRATGLHSLYYDRILDFFHSSGILLPVLTIQWSKLVIKYFPVYKKNNRLVLIGDGIKIAKSGKKMPGVKKLFQESESNTKPKYITGHSLQAVSLLVKTGLYFFAVPLMSRIHEGVVFSNRDKRTLLDKMILILAELTITPPYYFVADAYYACKKIINGVLKADNHLISRVKTNAVAYHPAPKIIVKGKRGRKKKYGKKIALRTLFEQKDSMIKVPSPIVGEQDIILHVKSMDLIWRQVGIMVRFVAVIHPIRGKILLMSTDRQLSASDIIELYSLRFKIEVSFKQAVNTIGVYSYHFWMRSMKKRGRNGKKQYLHKESQEYREKVKRKIHAYHCFIQTGLIVQGMLHYLSCRYTKQVWKSFGSWLRTIRPNVLPSEMVVMTALRNKYPEFLTDCLFEQNLKKFIIEKMDLERSEARKLMA